MIVTGWIWARLGALLLFTALAQVTFFSKIELFGSSPDGAVLVVIALGLLGGSVTGAVSGFTIGLLVDCLLMQTLGAFAAALMAVGYVAGRYREGAGPPARAAVPVLGGGLTLLGAVAFAAIQIGTGIDADVSTLVVRDAVVKTLLGVALAFPVFWLVRLILRPALIEDTPTGRRPRAPRPLEQRG
ncbi:MAG: rod shape-determining protein MreD [Solirubrobacterales bacterium]